MNLIKGRLKIVIHSGFWLIFMGLSFFFYANFWPLQTAFIRAIVNGVLFIALFYINLRILIPWLFRSGRYYLYALASLLTILFFGLVRIAMRELWFGTPATVVIQDKPYVSEFLIGSSLLFVFMISVFYQLVENQLHARERNREMARQRDEAELKMLKSQVNPHFLFNTLNNLYTLSYTGSGKTPEAILSLSEIMRYLIYETGVDFVPVEKEIRFLSNYINLEKLRIEDAGKVSLTVEQPGLGLRIPPLLFISFIENAFKHSGIDADPEGFIQIFLSFGGGEILFTCENSILSGMTPRDKGGMGIANARARLDLIYPGGHTLTFRSTNLVYSVSLTIRP